MNKAILVLAIATILVASSITTGDVAFADKDDKKDKKKSKTTKAIHLGFLQLAAHDFFDVNRCLDADREIIDDCFVVDNENGKLDLSTILFNPYQGACDFKESLDNDVEYVDLDGDGTLDEVICSLYDDEPNGSPVPAISNGGEKRSVENIMISTAGALTGEKYLKLKEKFGEEKAYKKTLKYYHKKNRPQAG